MRIEFARLWALALMPVMIICVALIDRKHPRANLKRSVARAVRMALVALLALALAGPSCLTGSDLRATWVLLDASDSARDVRRELDAAVGEAMESAPGDLMTGVIAFGANAMVETPLMVGASFDGIHTAVDSSGSELADALQLAGALLNADAAGRIAVVSDGKVGDLTAQAALLKARGIPVDVLVASGDVVADAQVTEVSVPSPVYQNQSFHVTVSMQSNMDVGGTLVLYANRQPVATRQVTLRKGENSYVFEDVAQASGVVTYEAQLIANGDMRPQNDRKGAYMMVLGVPNVLIVEGAAGEGREIQKMLEAAGMRSETASPGGLPSGAEALRQYDAVVMANVNAGDLSEAAMQALDGYVQSLGRGLVVTGGDNSYALGGYRGSALEQMLPVTIDVRNQADMPSLALLLVIDKSGSMTEGQFGTTRIEMAKEAAMRATEVLTAKDQVGVIAFDDASKWVAPLQKVTDVAAIQQAIGTIRAGGGTAFYSPLRDAYAALLDAQAQLKHVIFLTDGQSGDSGYEQLAVMMAADGITMTTVAVGSGASTEVLKRMAEMGGGRAYVAGEFDNIPEIFTKETYLVSGAYVQNRAFTPVIAEMSALTDFGGFPALAGYLAATEKPIATVSLVTDRDDPLLSWWQYGAGRVLAWTSDSSGAWTGQLLAWPRAAEFYSGMVSHVLNNGLQDGELSANLNGDQLEITYIAPADASVQGLETTARVLMPDGAEQQLSLTESAPGTYQGVMAAEQQGAYALRVEQTQAGATVRVMEGGAVRSYSREYDLTAQTDASALTRLAEATGGRVLANGSELFAARGGRVETRRDLTRALLIASLVLLLVGVALRRLSWERWLQAALARRAERISRPKAAPAVRAKTSPVGSASPSLRTPETEKKPREPAPSDTAGALLKARQQKKKL